MINSLSISVQDLTNKVEVLRREVKELSEKLKK